MSKPDISKKIEKPSSPMYQDMIMYEQALVKNINEKQRYLIKEYETIVNALKNEDHLTVKEIHQYYYDPIENKETKTIKTVYKYLEILEQEGIVAHSGQRMTKGKRVNEKLYCLSARYFHNAQHPIGWWDTEESQKFVQKISLIISKVLKIPGFQQASSTDIMHQFFRIQSSSIYYSFVSIMEALSKDEEIGEILTEDYYEDQNLIAFTAQLLTLIEHHELRSILLELISIYANAKAIEE